MSNYSFFLLGLCAAALFSCDTKSPSTTEDAVSQQTNPPVYLELTTFQTILDSADVKGSILLYDLHADTYYSNDFDWAKKGQLPASTFKITNSIIGLETGVVEDDSTLFEWDGTPRNYKHWELDLVFRDAFHYSCVPCYQKVARGIGSARMNEYLDKLNYGQMDVDSSNIDMFWLEGNSRISQMEQIEFLKRIYHSELPISERTDMLMKRMMIIEETDTTILRGKTGWSVDNDWNNGWFVGYLELEDNVWFFATNVEPIDQNRYSHFASARKEVTMVVLTELNSLK